MSTTSLRNATVLSALTILGAMSSAHATTRLAIVVESIANPYFVCIREGAEEEAKKHSDLQLTFIGGATSTDLVGMTRMIDDLLQKGVDVISFNAIDPTAMIREVKKAQEKGVKVLMHSDDTAQQVADHYVGANQYQIEFASADLLAKQIGGVGKVAILTGVPGNMTAVQRTKGAQDALKKYPGIEIVGEWTGNWDRAEGLQKAQDILTAHPDLNGIVADNDEMALGALQAVRGRNLAGKVAISGANGMPEAVKAVYKGDLTATVVTYCKDIGQAIVTTALKMEEGGGEKGPYGVDTRFDAIDTRLAKTLFEDVSK
jgi:ABC-type sugar transport system substrate-binding protein